MTEKTTPTICFIDTETTGLHPARRAWDIAVIVRRPDLPDEEHAWLIDVDDLDLGNADPFGLRVGHFYDRHPMARRQNHGVQPRTAAGAKAQQWLTAAGQAGTVPEVDALEQVERLTRGAHVVGNVPNFDTEVLGTRMRAHGILPSWHYHLIDVENLAVGYLTAAAVAVEALRGVPLPWDSEALSRALGVEPPPAEVRHTAIGDARWARDMYDAVMGTGAGR